jgi:hypothetical protein
LLNRIKMMHTVFATLLGFLYNPVPIFIGQKYYAMRCIPLIGLYNTPYYDVDSVGEVFYF